MKKRLLLTSVFIVVCTGIFAQSDKNQYIDKLMQKMTLQEKIGQLNLLPGNDITT
jgi:beta-glucosidase